jgi:hypothetical protein
MDPTTRALPVAHGECSVAIRCVMNGFTNVFMRFLNVDDGLSDSLRLRLDKTKKTISYCVKDATCKIHQEGKIGSTRCELDAGIKTFPQPRMKAMEATIFAGWIRDHLLPHAEKLKMPPRYSYELVMVREREIQRETRIANPYCFAASLSTKALATK